MNAKLPANFGCKTTIAGNQSASLSVRRFKLNCTRDKEMDVSTSALVDGVAEILSGLFYKRVNCVQKFGYW